MSKTYLKRAVPAAQAAKDLAGVKETVTAVIADIREHGDAAVREYSAKFDNWSPEAFRLTPAQVDDIIAGLPGQVIEDITFAQAQVRGFAQAQLASMQAVEVETLPGVFLGHKHLPVSSAGSYIPGGRYPLTASAHMTVLTAKAAGVERVVACTPPIRGEIPAATVAAAHVLPTRGAARYTGGLWVGKYLKTVTYQEVRDPSSSALLGDVCGRASRVELFEGHARSGDIRAAKIRGTRPAWLAEALGR